MLQEPLLQLRVRGHLSGQLSNACVLREFEDFLEQFPADALFHHDRA